MKRNIKIITKIICFCLIFVLLLDCVNSLFKPKWLEDRWQSSKTDISFYQLKKNSTDVLFYGSSVTAAAVDPFQLYNDYGISSYNLGVISQTMSGTYFWVKESLKTQKPKVIFVEIKTLGRHEDKLETKARKSYDYMHIGKNKLQYAFETVNTGNTSEDANEADGEMDIWEYLFPLSVYHTRWSELDYDDYDFSLGNNRSDTKGYAALADTFKYVSSYDKDMDEAGKYDGFEDKTVKYKQYNSTNKSYAKRIAKLAKENNVELVFYKTPDTSWSVKKYNYVKDIADKLGVKYIDFNLKSIRQELNLDFAEDGADSIHMNIKGAKKVTSYIGEYLTKNYKLTNYKNGNSDVKKDFEAGMKNYEYSIASSKLSMETSLSDYLKDINNKDYSIILTAGSAASRLHFSTEELQLLRDMNVDIDKFQKETLYKNNIAYVSDKLATGTFANVTNEEDKYTTQVIHEGGQFKDGTSYSIDVSGGLCSVRINNNNCSDITEDAMNIVVYNKNTKKTIDTVYLYNRDNGTVGIGRKGKG